MKSYFKKTNNPRKKIVILTENQILVLKLKLLLKILLIEETH